MKNYVILLFALSTIISCEQEENLQPKESTVIVPEILIDIPPIPAGNIIYDSKVTANGRIYNKNEYGEFFISNPDVDYISDFKNLGGNTFPWAFAGAKINDVPVGPDNPNGMNNELQIQAEGFAAMWFYYGKGAQEISFKTKKAGQGQGHVRVWALFGDNVEWKQIGSASASNIFSDKNIISLIDQPIAIGFSAHNSTIVIDDVTISAYNCQAQDIPAHEGCHLFGYPYQNHCAIELANPTSAEYFDHQDDHPWNFISNNIDDYVSSYNTFKMRPNWVAAHVSAAWMGDVDVDEQFLWVEDIDAPLLNPDFDPNVIADASFAMGHLIDPFFRNKNLQGVQNTYFATNLVAMNPLQDQSGPWRQMELYLQDLALNQDKEIYLFAGGSGEGGLDAAGFYLETIEAGEDAWNDISVPKELWMIALIKDNTDEDYCAIVDNAEMLAFLVPNTFSNDGLQNYILSVDELEVHLTNENNLFVPYDFFSGMIPYLEDELESQVYQF